MFRLDRLVVISSVQEPSIISRVETLALKSLSELGTVVHGCHSSTWEVEADRPL